MRNVCLMLLAALLSQTALAVPYPKADFGAIINDSKPGVELGALQTALSNLWVHARQYPLQFDNAADQAQAKHDIDRLLYTIKVLKAPESFAKLPVQTQRYLTLSEARLAVMGYNFGQPGMGGLADGNYQALLQAQPEAALHDEFGQFLANSGQLSRASVQFQSAVNRGYTASLYGLAMVDLAENRRGQAIGHLKAYLKHHPENRQVRQLLTQLQDPNTTIQTRREPAGSP